MGAHSLPEASVLSLIDEMKVVIAQRGKERIRISFLPNRTVCRVNLEQIVVRSLATESALEDPGEIGALMKGDPNGVLQNVDSTRIRPKGPKGQIAAGGMCPEQPVWVVVSKLNELPQRVVNH
jgi:hypothetical protein